MSIMEPVNRKHIWPLYRDLRPKKALFNWLYARAYTSNIAYLKFAAKRTKYSDTNEPHALIVSLCFQSVVSSITALCLSILNSTSWKTRRNTKQKR